MVIVEPQNEMYLSDGTPCSSDAWVVYFETAEDDMPTNGESGYKPRKRVSKHAGARRQRKGR